MCKAILYGFQRNFLFLRTAESGPQILGFGRRFWAGICGLSKPQIPAQNLCCAEKKKNQRCFVVDTSAAPKQFLSLPTFEPSVSPSHLRGVAIDGHGWDGVSLVVILAVPQRHVRRHGWQCFIAAQPCSGAYHLGIEEFMGGFKAAKPLKWY
jgi:hypothetical protein